MDTESRSLEKENGKMSKQGTQEAAIWYNLKTNLFSMQNRQTATSQKFETNTPKDIEMFFAI
jgi:hypothetical protein